MPMSGVRSQLLPLQGELSTRSLAPAASTAGWLASMASAGSLTPLGRYGVGGLPTETLLSADTALAGARAISVAARDSKTERTARRRTVIGFLPSWRPAERCVRLRKHAEGRERTQAADCSQGDYRDRTPIRYRITRRRPGAAAAVTGGRRRPRRGFRLAAGLWRSQPAR